MSGTENFPPIGLDYQQRVIGAWGDQTFPKSTMKTIAAHLLREAVALYIRAHADDFALDWATAQDDLHSQSVAELAKASDRLDASLVQFHDPARLPEECADVFLLLLHAAHRGGFSLQSVAATKFRAIKDWAWGEPDQFGVTERKAEGGDGATEDPGTVGATDPVQ